MAQKEFAAVYEKRAAKAIAGLKKRGMDGIFVQDAAQAAKLALSLIPVGSSVAWGGSISLARDLKLFDAVRQGPYEPIDRDAAATPEQVEACYRAAFSADFYLMSANAITMDGKLVNVDGRGNRVAALVYGPRRVIVVAGCNKLCPDLETALSRARNEAAPVNTERLGCDTPCRGDGMCHSCLVDDCICCQVLVTRKSKPAGRISVILVGEALGF